MSVTVEVFVEAKRLFTSEAWAAEIRAHGFELEVDSFNPKTHSGFLPCRLRGEACGFEYFYKRVADLDLSDEPDLEEAYQRRCVAAGSRDVIVSFVTRSSMVDAASAAIAASVLTAVCDGMLSVEGDEPAITGEEALDWARGVEHDAGAAT